MTTKVSFEQAKELIERAIAEKGADHVYVDPHGQVSDGSTSCFYFQPDPEGNIVPGCIVGHLFSYLGVRPEQVAEYTGVHGALKAGAPIILSPEARRFLALIQRYQDRGAPWGTAYANALASLSKDL